MLCIPKFFYINQFDLVDDIKNGLKMYLLTDFVKIDHYNLIQNDNRYDIKLNGLFSFKVSSYEEYKKIYLCKLKQITFENGCLWFYFSYKRNHYHFTLKNKPNDIYFMGPIHFHYKTKSYFYNQSATLFLMF
ncbi:MAG TPA: hypothetical protein VLG50_05220 [Candidatus Saccharimonadales bacterium]|nr:hypothetical protein [Candidatus Saccharimonadales bacterium]